MTLVAHIGHWTTSLAFFAPVVVLPLGLYAVVLIDRRRAQETEADAAD